MLKPPQRRDSWIRDGGGDQLSNVHPSLLHLVQPSPAATLISHNYLGCAGVANANLGGGATPPFTTREPKLWEHFWREVDATTTSPPH